MAQTKPPYRAEHIGSLPRPERLMAAREQYAARKLSKAELTQIEDECIREAVAMQERVDIGAMNVQRASSFGQSGSRIVRRLYSKAIRPSP
jgi:methionine synthase II (cobalamin-independent)